MANLNLGSDVANKKERKQTADHIVAKTENNVRCWRDYGSGLVDH